MKDINTALLRAYYKAIDDAGIIVYEGEEPDDVKDKIYAVISDVTSTETSTKNSSDVQATVQISVHSWEYKYNNSKTLNEAVNTIYQAVKSSQNTVRDLSAYGLQMLNLLVQTDRTERLGEIAGKVYITRILVFKQDVFII